jgi:hypothetical protein
VLEALQKLKEQNVQPESGKNRWTTVMLGQQHPRADRRDRPLRWAVLPAGGHHRRRPHQGNAIAEITMIGDLLFGRR